MSFDPTASDLFYFTTGADVNIIFDETGATDGGEVLIKVDASAALDLDFTGDVVIPSTMAALPLASGGYYHLRAVFDLRLTAWVPFALVRVF